jgi:fatty acid amide hydrolase
VIVPDLPGGLPDLGSVVTIAADVSAGRRAASDVLAVHQARHEVCHPHLNALVQTRYEAARREAALGPTGALAGVPVSIKECFPVRGLLTTLGIPGYAEVPDAEDADIVKRLRSAGAIIVGKANVPQVMYLHEIENPVWGRTNHPMTTDRGPGGSSGGDAALVAAGVVPLAVGSDLAGSLRQPAHACGIAAIMPRSEVLGEGGAFNTQPNLRAVRARAGFLARHVDDLRVALEAITPFSGSSAEPVRRVGWWDEGGPIPASQAIRRGVAEAVERLHRAGIETVRLSGDLAEEAAWLHLAILSAGGGRDIRRLFTTCKPIPGVARLLTLGGMSQPARSLVAAVARVSGRRLEAKGLARTGPRNATELADLVAEREALAARFADHLVGCDAVVCPVSALPALRHGTAARLILAAAPCLAANLLGLAAGAVPVTTVRPDEAGGRPRSVDPVLRLAAATDRGSAGLPVGVQVVAAPGRGEATVLDVMRLIEAGSLST